MDSISQYFQLLKGNFVFGLKRINLSTTSILIVFLLTFILIPIYNRFIKRDGRIKKAFKNIPGPPTIPIFGNVLSFAVPHTELLDTMHNLVAKYGAVIRLWMFNEPYVMLTSAESSEKIMSSSTHIERSRDYKVMRPWLGNALGLMGGAHWATRRKFLTPAFTFGLQDEFLQVFNEQGEIMRRVLETEVVDKGAVDLYPYCFRYSLDVICEAAMGSKIKAQTEKNAEYLTSIIGVTRVIVTRISRPWLQPDWIWNLSGDGRQEKKYLKTLHTFADNVIKDRRHLLESNEEMFKKIKGTSKFRLAFLDLLLQSQMRDQNQNAVPLTDTEIRDETNLFMAAGHDTSGSALSWTLFALAHHPQIQRRVQAELDEIFGDDPERLTTNEDMTKMQYLEMCFKESIRLRTPIPIIFRKLYEDVELPDGKVLPAGTSVAVNLHGIHQDPVVYPNPEKYDPERFSPANCSGRNSYAWMPFSAGPRSCMGQRFAKIQAKFILSTLLRHFWFEPAETWESVKIVPDVNMRPVNGLHFRVTKRDKK